MRSYLVIDGKALLPVIILAMLVFLLPGGAWPVAADDGGIITADELLSTLERGEEVTLIDVRTPEEFEDGHIPGSISLPLATLREGGDIPSKGDVVLYCATGVRSARAMRILAGREKMRLMELEGGIRAWVDAGGNVVAGPYKTMSDYPGSFEIPTGVCETEDPSMIIGK
jgi:rhodanese-related sulfurtransferase